MRSNARPLGGSPNEKSGHSCSWEDVISILEQQADVNALVTAIKTNPELHVEQFIPTMTTEKSLRKMRSYTCTKWNGIHLQLRMHILCDLRRANCTLFAQTVEVNL